MKRLRFMTWIIVPAALFLTYAMFGLPHFRWTYTWLDQGQGYDPLAHRHYVSCTFWGPYGRYTIRYPAQGKCAWIIFKTKSQMQRG